MNYTYGTTGRPVNNLFIRDHSTSDNGEPSIAIPNGMTTYIITDYDDYGHETGFHKEVGYDDNYSRVGASDINGYSPIKTGIDNENAGILREIVGFVENGGTIGFSACGLGPNGDFADAIGKASGNDLTVYLNSGHTGVTRNRLNDDKEIEQSWLVTGSPLSALYRGWMKYNYEGGARTSSGKIQGDLSLDKSGSFREGVAIRLSAVNQRQ